MAESAADLLGKHCLPCEAGTPPLAPEEAALRKTLVPGWEVRDAKSLRRRFRLEGFRQAIAFVNRMADLAEAEGHHPDFCVRFTVLDVSVTTHAIGGLSENDFVLAAKIDELPAH